MRVAAAAAAAICTFFSFIQLTPAPVAAVAEVIAGALQGGITTFTGSVLSAATALGVKGAAGHHKRDGFITVDPRGNDPFANLPQPAADECKGQLHGATINFSPLPNNGVQIDGVPSACMTLATVFLGTNPEGPAPTPMGMYIELVLDV